MSISCVSLAKGIVVLIIPTGNWWISATSFPYYCRDNCLRSVWFVSLARVSLYINGSVHGHIEHRGGVLV